MSRVDVDEQELRKRYRIVTNGYRWSVERLTSVGWLWWRREEWIPLCIESPWSCRRVTFETDAEAKRQITASVQKELAKRRGWAPVVIIEDEVRNEGID